MSCKSSSSASSGEAMHIEEAIIRRYHTGINGYPGMIFSLRLADSLNAQQLGTWVVNDSNLTYDISHSHGSTLLEAHIIYESLDSSAAPLFYSREFQGRLSANGNSITLPAFRQLTLKNIP